MYSEVKTEATRQFTLGYEVGRTAPFESKIQTLAIHGQAKEALALYQSQCVRSFGEFCRYYNQGVRKRKK